MIELNKKEYGENYDQLRWISETEAGKASDQRNKIMIDLKDSIQFLFKNTKPFLNKLSQGCKICGQGSWSCLFINSRCNCRCFYCPAEQMEDSVPMTNTLPFPKSSDYADYINKFGFKGMSISGGEPLLTLDTTLNYIQKVRKKAGENIYIWLYTNGTMVTGDILLKLKDAGLDEIRFDIGAVNYNLEKVKAAINVINYVTVEIPAVPEDFELMKKKIPEMKDIGINYLNLHQLRLTPYNYEKIAKRNYTFLHEEKVTVLESELTALNLFRYLLENKIELPVNYCSFVYKNQFQKAAVRKRNASCIRKIYEDITEQGYIRYLFISGTVDNILNQVNILIKNGCRSDHWFLKSSKDRLYFNEKVFKFIEFKDFKLFCGYFEARILPVLSFHNPFIEINLNKNRNVVIEKIRASEEFELYRDELGYFENYIINKQESFIPYPENKKWFEIQRLEFIRSGLQEYF
ncbi:MAG: hypothetical protein A2161_10300 [Candidatus Schekmanbacteria bacterium RBG_13_48_7]|uniref:Radical SAM core domain-containing protein n=1 Tax=Candidatus Schekmanbacteria bacterium RBG_13_48_7 TaxID=1817878 RepID=A0A1F7S2N3_9BACT|nr:MAG: hypothetical protein A2161_10300 [Candidatus Schekmanbacteria bacterium RBG_13_48_7]